MNIVPVDHNAMNPGGSLHLGFPDTKEALRSQGVGPGDGIWASDGEVFVGAVLAIDPVDGLVAVPHWETIVHLDDYTPADFERVRAEFVGLLQQPKNDLDDGEIYRLITVLEHLGPANWADAVEPGYLAFRRAGSLYALNELELTLLALREARQERPGDLGWTDLFYQEVLYRHDPVSACREADEWAANADASARTLAACINTVTAAAEDATDKEFAALGPKLLIWFERFQHASGRDRVLASTLALSQFNHGLVLLRLGRSSEARSAFQTAHAIDPTEPTIDEAQHLRTYDNAARELAARYRAKPLILAA